MLELAHPGPLPVRLEPRASLTMAVLGRDAAAWIDAYQRQDDLPDDIEDERPELGFLAFVIAHADDPIAQCMARFERAIAVADMVRTANASDATPAPPTERLALHEAACTIDLPGPADQVIAAVSLGLAVPPYQGFPVLVAPGLPTLWRQATTLEDALCTWLTRPRSRAEILERFGRVEPVIDRLRSARALVDVA